MAVLQGAEIVEGKASRSPCSLKAKIQVGIRYNAISTQPASRQRKRQGLKRWLHMGLNPGCAVTGCVKLWRIRNLSHFFFFLNL